MEGLLLILLKCKENPYALGGAYFMKKLITAETWPVNFPNIPDVRDLVHSNISRAWAGGQYRTGSYSNRKCYLTTSKVLCKFI